MNKLSGKNNENGKKVNQMGSNHRSRLHPRHITGTNRSCSAHIFPIHKFMRSCERSLTLTHTRFPWSTRHKLSLTVENIWCRQILSHMRAYYMPCHGMSVCVCLSLSINTLEHVTLWAISSADMSLQVSVCVYVLQATKYYIIQYTLKMLILKRE